MIHGAYQWSVYIYANQAHLTIFTDASGLSYFFRMKQFKSKFSLASNYLSTFLASPGLTIQCISGHHNILAECISRVFHTLAEDEILEYYAISREKEISLPPIPEHGTFSPSAMWQILLKNPKPEAKDSENRHERPCRNPLTPFEEVRLMLNKTKEEKYMDFQEFVKGHENRIPSRDYVEASTEHLSPLQNTNITDNTHINSNFAARKITFNDNSTHSSDKPDIDEIFDTLLKVQYYRIFLLNFLNLLDAIDHNKNVLWDQPLLSVWACG